MTKNLEGERLEKVMGDAFRKSEMVARNYLKLGQVMNPFNALVVKTTMSQYKSMNETPSSKAERHWQAYVSHTSSKF